MGNSQASVSKPIAGGHPIVGFYTRAWNCAVNGAGRRTAPMEGQRVPAQPDSNKDLVAMHLAASRECGNNRCQASGRSRA